MDNFVVTRINSNKDETTFFYDIQTSREKSVTIFNETIIEKYDDKYTLVLPQAISTLDVGVEFPLDLKDFSCVKKQQTFTNKRNEEITYTKKYLFIAK